MKRDEVRHSLPCISNLSHIHREKKNILKKYYLSINCGSFIEGGDWRTRVKCQETLPDFGASLVSSETWEHCFYIIAGVFFIMLLHRINHSLERLKYQRQTGYKGTCRIVFFFFQRRTSREEDDTLTKISCWICNFSKKRSEWHHHHLWKEIMSKLFTNRNFMFLKNIKFWDSNLI